MGRILHRSYRSDCRLVLNGHCGCKNPFPPFPAKTDKKISCVSTKLFNVGGKRLFLISFRCPLWRRTFRHSTKFVVFQKISARRFFLKRLSVPAPRTLFDEYLPAPVLFFFDSSISSWARLKITFFVLFPFFHEQTSAVSDGYKNKKFHIRQR